MAGLHSRRAVSGRFAEARAADERSRGDQGRARRLGYHARGRGDLERRAELLAGDYAAAEGAFRAAAEFLQERGDRNFYPTAAAGIARACFHQGRYEESDDALRSAEGDGER